MDYPMQFNGVTSVPCARSKVLQIFVRFGGDTVSSSFEIGGHVSTLTVNNADFFIIGFELHSPVIFF